MLRKIGLGVAVANGNDALTDGLRWAWSWTRPRSLEPWSLEPRARSWPMVARPLVWLRCRCMLALDTRRLRLDLLLAGIC